MLCWIIFGYAPNQTMTHWDPSSKLGPQVGLFQQAEKNICGESPLVGLEVAINLENDPR